MVAVVVVVVVAGCIPRVCPGVIGCGKVGMDRIRCLQVRQEFGSSEGTYKLALVTPFSLLKAVAAGHGCCCCCGWLDRFEGIASIVGEGLSRRLDVHMRQGIAGQSFDRIPVQRNHFHCFQLCVCVCVLCNLSTLLGLALIVRKGRATTSQHKSAQASTRNINIMVLLRTRGSSLASILDSSLASD